MFYGEVFGEDRSEGVANEDVFFAEVEAVFQEGNEGWQIVVNVWFFCVSVADEIEGDGPKILAEFLFEVEKVVSWSWDSVDEDKGFHKSYIVN